MAAARASDGPRRGEGRLTVLRQCQRPVRLRHHLETQRPRAGEMAQHEAIAPPARRSACRCRRRRAGWSPRRSAPCWRAMKRHAVSPLLLFAWTTQVPSMAGAAVAEPPRRHRREPRAPAGARRVRVDSAAQLRRPRRSTPGWTRTARIGRSRLFPSTRASVELSRRSPLKKEPWRPAALTPDLEGERAPRRRRPRRPRPSALPPRPALGLEAGSRTSWRHRDQRAPPCPVSNGRSLLISSFCSRHGATRAKTKRPGKLRSLPGLNCESSSCASATALREHDPETHSAAVGGLFSGATTRAGRDHEHDGCRYPTSRAGVSSHESMTAGRRTAASRQQSGLKRAGLDIAVASTAESCLAMPLPDWLEPMAATLTAERFMDPAWTFERKLDGIRMLAYKDGSRVRLLSRNRLSLVTAYPARRRRRGPPPLRRRHP